MRWFVVTRGFSGHPCILYDATDYNCKARFMEDTGAKSEIRESKNHEGCDSLKFHSNIASRPVRLSCSDVAEDVAQLVLIRRSLDRNVVVNSMVPCS